MKWCMQMQIKTTQIFYIFFNIFFLYFLFFGELRAYIILNYQPFEVVSNVQRFTQKIIYFLQDATALEFKVLYFNLFFLLNVLFKEL